MIEFGIVVLIAILWLFIYFRRKKLALQSPIDSVNEAEIPLKAESKAKPEVKVSVGDNVKAPVVAELLEAGGEADTVPEDSALRRHYLQNLASQGDSITITSEAVAKVSRLASVIPEDAVLKRHFIHQLTTEIATTMPARPTDSALKRHYDAQLLSAVASKLEALK